MLIKVTEHSVRCRICLWTFVPDEPGDAKSHKEGHAKLAKGGLPLEVREFLKAFGSAAAHNDGGIDRIKEHQDKEVGKLAVAYSWWARASMNGISETEFDRFMADHLHFIDTKIDDDIDSLQQAAIEIKKWERYAG